MWAAPYIIQRHHIYSIHSRQHSSPLVKKWEFRMLLLTRALLSLRNPHQLTHRQGYTSGETPVLTMSSSSLHLAISWLKKKLKVLQFHFVHIFWNLEKQDPIGGNRNTLTFFSYFPSDIWSHMDLVLWPPFKIKPANDTIYELSPWKEARVVTLKTHGSSSTVPLLMEFKFPRDFPGGLVVKNPPAHAGDTGSISGPGRSHMLQGN